MKNVKYPIIYVLFLFLSGCSSLGTLSPMSVSTDYVRDKNCVESPYKADEINGAYETVLPVSKNRAKELYVDSATPLGFRFDKVIDDEVTVIARATDRSFSLGKHLEGHLYSRFEDVDGGTRIYVDSESLEIVGKSRDHSYSGSIIKHMICLHSILDLDTDDIEQDALQNRVQDQASADIELLNYRFISSRTAQNEEPIKFIVKQSLVVNGKIVIGRGAIARGHVLVAKPAGAFGVKGKLIIGIDKVQTTNGQWLPLVFKNDQNSLDVESDRDLFSKFTPFVLTYALAQGAQPSIPAGTTIEAKFSLP